MFEAVRNNAAKVLGLDAAQGALDKALELAKQVGIEDKLEFHCSDFLEFESSEKYDVIFAVGYFDYIFNPETHMKKMYELSSGKIYASFPKRWSIFSAIRKIRLILNNCPVRYYSKRQIKKLMKDIGCESYEIKRIFRDNILIIDKV
jgi:trans-aconitate methyltransferase